MRTTFPDTRHPLEDGEFDLEIPVDDEGFVYYALSIVLRYTLESGGTLPGIDARELSELMTRVSSVRLEWCLHDADQYQQDPPMTISSTEVLERTRDLLLVVADCLENGSCTVLPATEQSPRRAAQGLRTTADTITKQLLGA